MDLRKYLPENASDYIECFRKLAALTDSALNHAEHRGDWTSAIDKHNSLSRIAESVETLASLRGDSGEFYDARPDGLVAYQKEMYATEAYLRSRLVSLGYKYPSPSEHH